MSLLIIVTSLHLIYKFTSSLQILQATDASFRGKGSNRGRDRGRGRGKGQLTLEGSIGL